MHLALLLAVCCIKAHGVAPLYSDYNYYIDYKKIVNDLCGDTIAPAKISDEERADVAATGASPVYGEILYESVIFLIEELKLTKDDVFYDLGSGLGKFVFLVYLMTPVMKSAGVEFSPNRSARAIKNEDIIRKLYPQCLKCENSLRKTLGKPQLKKVKKQLELQTADMLKVDISDATVIYTCSTCFDAAFMKKLTDKFAAECNDGVRIVTLNQLAEHEYIHLTRVYKLPMTWSADTAVYLYVVDRTKKQDEDGEGEEGMALESESSGSVSGA